MCLRSREEKAEAKKEAWLLLKSIIEDIDHEQGIESLKILKPSMFPEIVGTGRYMTCQYQAFVNMFEYPGDTVSAQRLFDEFGGAGRAEITAFIRDYLKKTKDKKKKWIVLDKENKCYVLICISEDPPDGWTGYRP